MSKVIKIGDKFETYSEFQMKLKEYKNKVFNDFWIRDSRTIEKQAQRYPDSTASKANKQLVYYYLRIACIKGGRTHIPRNKTRHTFTFRQNCPASMFLKLTSCGNFLEVKELNETHTHPTTPSLFKSLPQQRLKFSDQLKMNSTASLHARANKRIVRNNIIKESGCLVTLKDLTNLNRKPQQRLQFEKCISILRNTYKCDVHIFADENENLKCLYLQDPEMKHMFESNPEIIFVDGTYRLHRNRAATYLIMVEDAEGGGEIVACGILMNETEEIIDWFIKTFKKQNPKSSQILVIMSDKDDKKRNVFKQNFLNASLQIRLFHTLQIFNREVNVKKMGLTTEECETAKNYLKKLAYATSEENYQKTYSEMKNNVPQVVRDYYEKNWEPIKDEWVLYLTFGNMSFFNKTNNRVENVSAKLKSVLSKFSDLEDFIKKFFVVLNSLRVDGKIKNSKHYHKVSTTVLKSNSPGDLYCKLLTNFAFNKIQRQLESIDSCKEFRFIEEQKCLAHTSEGLLEVTPFNCQCLFWSSIKLPCRHIFKLRSLCNLPLFDENLCLDRWKRTYFESTHSKNYTVDTDSTTTETICHLDIMNEPKEHRPLTNHQKFKLMNDECLQLARICSEVSPEIFYSRLDFIKSLAREWSNSDLKSKNGESDKNVQLNTCLNGGTQYRNLHRNSAVDVLKANDVQSEEDCSKVIISDIKVPVVKLRRLPKGCGNTVIGLKKKENNLNKTKN